MVPTTNDLASVDRAKYRIRKLETYNNVDYFAYYLKVIPTANTTVESRVIEIHNGVIVSDVAFTPSLSDLTPSPINIDNVITNISEGKHLVTQAVLPITLNATDINNIIAACIIKYGDIRYATISEIGIVGGFDTPVSTNLGGIAASYDEIQTGQVMAFIGTVEELQQRPSSITLQYALSNSAPYPPTIG
jgi:hypothetical protein